MFILRILFLTTLFFFPFAQAFRFQLSGNVNFTVFDLSVVLTGSIWFVLAALGKSTYRKDALTKPILMFFLTMILSLSANFFRYELFELAVASLYAVRWLLFACIYFVILDQPVSFRKKIPEFLLVSGGSVVFLGYFQYIFYSNLRNLYYLGWDEHVYRMFSTFLDPNFLGVFFVLYLLFLLGYLLSGKSREGMFTYLLWGMCLATFTAIFLTTSRSALLMLIVSFVTFFMLRGQKRFIPVLLGIVVILLLFASRFFHIENINLFRTTSSLARVESAMNAVEIIADNSLFGVGFNAYRYAQIEYGFREEQTEFPSHADSGTDTSFLFVFATTGIIGLGAFLYFLHTLYKQGKRSVGVYRSVLIASLLGFVVSSIFINSLFYPSLLYWLFCIYALTDYT